MSLSQAHDETTAVRFGKYEVIQTLGTGGMASVYLAMLRENGTHRLLALKQSHGISSPKMWSEAIKEAKCGESIHHPNVVGVAEVGAGAQGPYIVMEYVEGGSLLSLLTEGASNGGARRLPVAIACRVVVDALRGLHAAHEAKDETGTKLGLIHRDVSPQNVLVRTDGVAKLADFGIAKLVQMSNTGPGLLRGKPGYVAPEQALGQQLDPRTDVFSMGIVLWECLTGRRLFRGADQHETLMRVVRRVPARADKIFPDIPSVVADVCRAALEKDKAARPQTAREFADLLEHAARAHKCFATHEQVGNYVQQVLAIPLSRRRRLLNEWCNHTGVQYPMDEAGGGSQRRGSGPQLIGTYSAPQMDLQPAGAPRRSATITPPAFSVQRPVLQNTAAMAQAPYPTGRQISFTPMEVLRPQASPTPPSTEPKGMEPSGVRLKPETPATSSTQAGTNLTETAKVRKPYPPTTRWRKFGGTVLLLLVWGVGFGCAKLKASDVKQSAERIASNLKTLVARAR